MNIVLVIFDTLRKDCLGTYGSPPWGKVHTPNFDDFAKESLVFTHVFPEALPTLPARRALYTGQRVYPFNNANFRLKGDFVGAPGWGPIPEEQDTLAELLSKQNRSTGSGKSHSSKGYRTALISDLYHMFKPSKNFWRGFDQWMFLRGQEIDRSRSGPEPTQAVIDHWLPPELQTEGRVAFLRQCLMNMYDRDREEDYFNARVLVEASRWLEQNRDAEQFFLVVESFDPHEPWFVPEHYRRLYDNGNGPEQVISIYGEGLLSGDLLRRTQANYSGLVTMCDRWFGHLWETLRVQGLLDNTIVIVTSDHGHSIGDQNFVGKRGYPSGQAVFDVPLMIRHPQGIGAGQRSALLLQHTDLSAQILDFASIEPNQPLHGKPFWKLAVSGGESFRDHVTVGWGTSITVIDEHWWLNCKVDGSGVFLRDLGAVDPFGSNVADNHSDVVHRLFTQAVADAGGEFPDYVLEMVAKQSDAPGCSALVARV
jgi:arylsulfatase A-like enzyme